MSKKNIQIIKAMRHFVDYDNPQNTPEPLLAFGEQPKLKEFTWILDGTTYEYRAQSERLQVDLTVDDTPIRVIVRFENLYAPEGRHLASISSDYILPNHSKKTLSLNPDVLGWNYEIEPDPDTISLGMEPEPERWTHDE